MSAIYLDAIGFSLGSVRNSAQEAEQHQLLLSPAELLIESGFGFHHRCAVDESVYDLAQRATQEIFAAAENSELAQQIDLFCFATCIPANGNIGVYDDFTRSGDVKYLMDFPVSHLQAQFKMERAQTIGITQMACTSLLGAIRIGASLLAAEDLEHCLCLTADRFPAGAKYEQSFNLISDGAAGCILSTKKGAFLYRGAHHITNGAMAQASDDETAGFFFNYSYRLIQETLQKLQLQLSDVQWIVPQNTNSKAWQVLASLLRFDLARVLMPTRIEVGHCISGDNMINLHACLQNNIFKSGDIILLPMAGYGLNWSCVVLEKM
jgi:3-oxoacyl-[acyl-carrier-protein] synthase III